MKKNTVFLCVKMFIYLPIFLFLVLYFIPTQLLRFDSFIFSINPDGIYRIFGIIFIIIGLMGYLYCSIWLVTIGKGPFVEFDPPKKLVTTGPFKYSRNPIVVLLLLTIFGETLFLNSVSNFIFFCLSSVLIYFQVKYIEEPILKRKWKEEYTNYCKTVPRWFPKFIYKS
jgi:protein-S-isoprenylcysteine O-methyltransferase Ste14